jgi:hypothetical protein
MHFLFVGNVMGIMLRFFVKVETSEELSSSQYQRNFHLKLMNDLLFCSILPLDGCKISIQIH